ncbi:MAG: hypothetical protein CMJ38_08960 [Phycisphaerae bacterium]|nr:hypothetical protein [Phycisphaerae bacterium]
MSHTSFANREESESPVGEFMASLQLLNSAKNSSVFLQQDIVLLELEESIIKQRNSPQASAWGLR